MLAESKVSWHDNFLLQAASCISHSIKLLLWKHWIILTNFSSSSPDETKKLQPLVVSSDHFDFFFKCVEESSILGKSGLSFFLQAVKHLKLCVWCLKLACPTQLLTFFSFLLWGETSNFRYSPSHWDRRRETILTLTDLRLRSSAKMRTFWKEQSCVLFLSAVI